MSEAKCNRHIPMLPGARVEQRHAMSARCWTICEICGAEMHRAGGEPWMAYETPTVSPAWSQEYAVNDAIIARWRKQAKCRREDQGR